MKNGIAFRAGEHTVDQVDGWGGAQDPGELAGCLSPVQAGKVQALNRATPVQLGKVGTELLLAWLIIAIGDHQQEPLAAEVADQEREQVAGGLIRPVNVLYRQHHGFPFAKPPQKAEQQFEQAELGGRAGWAAGWLAQGGQQPGQLGPARTDQIRDGFHA